MIKEAFERAIQHGQLNKGVTVEQHPNLSQATVFNHSDGTLTWVTLEDPPQLQLLHIDSVVELIKHWQDVATKADGSDCYVTVGEHALHAEQSRNQIQCETGRLNFEHTPEWAALKELGGSYTADEIVELSRTTCSGLLPQDFVNQVANLAHVYSEDATSTVNDAGDSFSAKAVSRTTDQDGNELPGQIQVEAEVYMSMNWSAQVRVAIFPNARTRKIRLIPLRKDILNGQALVRMAMRDYLSSQTGAPIYL